MRTRFYLVGPRKGQTVALGSAKQYHFVNGVMQFDGTAEAFANTCRSLEVNGWAYPEGHQMLQALVEEANGKRDIHPSSVVNADNGVRGDVQPNRSGVEASGARAEGTGAAGGEAGSPERVPGGDGQQASVTPAPVVQEEPATPARGNGKLLDALTKLDVNDDSHWTREGLPSVQVVSQFFGSGVTRATITAVSPNTTRDNVKKALAAIPDKD